MAATGRYKPAFTATIVPDAVELLRGDTGPYALMREAIVMRDGAQDAMRTVMAFGKAYRSVSHLLQTGRPIELSVRHHGGSLKVVGLPDGVDPASLLVPHEDGRSIRDTVILTLGTVLKAFGLDAEAIPGIVVDMMAGGVECDEDRVFDIDPDLEETLGHLLAPLAVAQIDEPLALAITDAIADLPIMRWLDDAALLRRQTTAREFLLAA